LPNPLQVCVFLDKLLTEANKLKDFTFQAHQKLLESLQARSYSFITFSEYLENKYAEKFIILRHDVEQRYENALKFAQIQHQLGIKGTYYFRILPKCFQPKIVKQIADLGHEVGYHYDDLAQCKGDYQKAIVRFKKNLNTLRDIAPVQTICMDGSPLSKYDNKNLWHPAPGTRHPSPSFQDFGIIGEPYFNTDFNKVFYITDTGRKWDGWKTSVRDKVPQQEEWVKQGLVFHSTQDIICALESVVTPAPKPVNTPAPVLVVYPAPEPVEGSVTPEPLEGSVTPKPLETPN
jgi:hypothetical protein